MWWLFFFLSGVSFVESALTNSCKFQNCRWSVVREAEDSTKVVVKDNSEHRINWQWNVKGGSWKVTYSCKYPTEWYSGKAVFISSPGTAQGENAFISWGSSVPWMSNAVLIRSATPWNITYNGDVFGFIPTSNGRYIFRVYSRNKRHDPFAAKAPLIQPSGQCSFLSSDPTQMNQWWQQQKLSPACPQPMLVWNGKGENGQWTVYYRYVRDLQKTACDVYYAGQGVTQMKIITWEVDEVKQSVSYATNPVRIFENAWQIPLNPAETWGFTPTGRGLWIFQHFSRNLIFQPFQEIRGTVLYTNLGAPSQPLYSYSGPTSVLNPSPVIYTSPQNVFPGK